MARLFVAKAEVYFEKSREIQQRLPFGVVDEIIECQDVTGATQVGAGRDHFGSRADVLQNLDDDAVRWQQFGGTAQQGFLVRINKCFGVPGKRLQIEKHRRTHDHAAGGVLAWLKRVVWAISKKQFVSKHLQPVVENGLAGDEPFVHAASPIGK